MKYLFKFIFPFLRSSVKERGASRVPSLKTHCFQNLAVSGERSIFTLGSLCLPCCVRLRNSQIFSDFLLKATERTQAIQNYKILFSYSCHKGTNQFNLYYKNIIFYYIYSRCGAVGPRLYFTPNANSGKTLGIDYNK